jgi:hypothetical protein
MTEHERHRNLRRSLMYIGVLVAGAIPLAALGFWGEIMGDRDPAALAIADGCVNWAHRPRAERQQESQDFIGKCDLYFKVRSDSNADEDEARFKARNAQAPEPPASR